MKILIVGCGGIGGVMASRLVRAGADVGCVAGNPEIAAAVAKDGFRVRDYDDTSWSVKPARAPWVLAGDAPATELGTYDLCVVATKATTLAKALSEAAPLLRDGAIVVACQNGLPEEIAAGVVGRAHVLGGVVVFGATMEAPGVYARTSKGVGGLQLGRPFPESPDAAAVAAVAKALEPVAPVTIVEDLAAARWSKLAINCATSTLGAVGGLRLGPLLRRRWVRRLVLEMWTEIVAVSRASGVRMAPIGGTLDIEKLTLSDAERRATLGSPALATKHAVLVGVGVKYRRMKSSMLVALERGRTPEIDFLNGEVARRGAALGVPTPINARLTAIVKGLASGELTGGPSIERLRGVFDELVAARTPEPLAA